jgi:D-xylose reductase
MDVHRYARIEPQVLQVELHPYLTQEPLVEVTKLLGIPITAYSSFGPEVRAEATMNGVGDRPTDLRFFSRITSSE